MIRFFAAISLILLISACNTQEHSAQKDKKHLVKVNNSTIQEVDRQSGQEISQHLEDLTAHVQNVEDATAVVIGRYAIVGIDVNANLERSEVDTVKYTVAETLKKDPHGARAAVVADPDLTARLKEVSADIKNGQPILGIMNELADIVGRIMPEVPADMIEPQDKGATEKQKKTLNQKDKDKLEKNQEKQSNYHK